MFNIFSLLPLCKGWDYKYNVWKRTVQRGQTMEVERISDVGVLVALGFTTNDAYGGIEFTAQGGDLGQFTIADVYPKGQYDQGAFVQDPSGWISRYYQPNPQSTAGVFTYYITTGMQGSTFPYIPTTVVKIFLKNDSTQTEAIVSLACLRIMITDEEQFIRSLRAILGMPMIQDIDPALLIAGTQEITQKGEFDKEKEKK